MTKEETEQMQFGRGGRGKARLKFAAVTLVVAVVVGCVAGWSLNQVLQDPSDPMATPAYAYSTVTEGTVGSSLSMSVAASWKPGSSASNEATGVVTTIDVEPGQTVDAGDTLYTVGLRPVVVAQGAIPAFRDIQLDSKGQDVAQLQGMLSSVGVYGGNVDGSAGPGTVSAIKSWQKSHGEVPTGTSGLADVIFVPTLPARVTLDPTTVATGKTIQPGSSVVNVLPDQPDFVLSMTAAQAALVAAGTRVEITGPSHQKWEAKSTVQESAASGEAVIVHLSGMSSASICGSDCSEIGATGSTTLSASVITAENATGSVIPTAGIESASDGQTFVVDQNGIPHNVVMVESARGLSVVTGVGVGSQIRMPSGQ